MRADDQGKKRTLQLDGIEFARHYLLRRHRADSTLWGVVQCVKDGQVKDSLIN